MCCALEGCPDAPFSINCHPQIPVRGQLSKPVKFFDFKGKVDKVTVENLDFGSNCEKE